MHWIVLLSVSFLLTVWAQNDRVSKQIIEYKERNPYPSNYTTSYGSPVAQPGIVLTAGKHGDVLLSDPFFLNEFFHFDRERIPERVVHAKGAGAIGYFSVTSTEITKYTKLAMFSRKGQMTPVFVRFSTTDGGAGSADTVRGMKGLSMKAYTDEGNWDLLCLHFPVFWIRDPWNFPSLAHASKKNPVTNLQDWNMFWDFAGLEPSTVYTTLLVHSDMGIPASYRHMNAYAINTFTLYDNEFNIWFCKFNFISNQGMKSMDPEEAIRQAGEDPNFYIRDLYNALETKNYPSWTLYVQVISQAEADKASFNIFDPTKYWNTSIYKPIEVGTLDLYLNADNYFSRVEQAAFNPGSMPPGICESFDKILQGRIFGYLDAQNYRLGPNWNLIPVNSPLRKIMEANNHRDGFAMVSNNQDGSPNYFPNSFNGPQGVPNGLIPNNVPVSGYADRYDTGDDDNFSQATEFWRNLSEKERNTIVDNIVETLCMTEPSVQMRVIKNFEKVSKWLASQLQKKCEAQKY